MIIGFLLAAIGPVVAVWLACVPTAERRGYWIDLRHEGGPAWRNYASRVSVLALHVVVSVVLFVVLYVRENDPFEWWVVILLPGAAVALARLCYELMVITKTLARQDH